MWDLSGPTHYNCTKALAALAEHLEKLAAQQKEASAAPADSERIKKQNEYLKQRLSRETDNTTKGFNQRSRAYYDQYNQIKLYGLGPHLSKADRYANAEKIIKIRQKISELFDQRDYYIETAKLIDANTDADTSNPYEIMRRISTLRSHISRYKKDPAKSESLADAEAEMKYLEAIKEQQESEWQE